MTEDEGTDNRPDDTDGTVGLNSPHWMLNSFKARFEAVSTGADAPERFARAVPKLDGPHGGLTAFVRELLETITPEDRYHLDRYTQQMTDQKKTADTLDKIKAVLHDVAARRLPGIRLDVPDRTGGPREDDAAHLVELLPAGKTDRFPTLVVMPLPDD